MTAIDEARVSEPFLELMVECADNHQEGCSCRWSGGVTLREVVIESHEGFQVVADLAPDERKAEVA